MFVSQFTVQFVKKLEDVTFERKLFFAHASITLLFFCFACTIYVFHGMSKSCIISAWNLRHVLWCSCLLRNIRDMFDVIPFEDVHILNLLLWLFFLRNDMKAEVNSAVEQGKNPPEQRCFSPLYKLSFSQSYYLPVLQNECRHKLSTCVHVSVQLLPSKSLKGPI